MDILALPPPEMEGEEDVAAAAAATTAAADDGDGDGDGGDIRMMQCEWEGTLYMSPVRAYRRRRRATCYV